MKDSVTNRIKSRKGAKSLKDIPEDVLDLLNQGEIETTNLIESLAIDQEILLENVLDDSEYGEYIEDAKIAINKLDKKTSIKCIKTIAESLFCNIKENNDLKIIHTLAAHASDTVRSWAAYIIGLDNGGIEEKLELIKPFAEDEHYGVREIAWLSVRESIIRDLEGAILTLSNWSIDENPNIRRFASESTRPRGVWAKHISELKEEPEIAIAILEPLKSDESKYVQDSVGNWLNDASKTRADWVLDLTKRWEKSSNTKETARIIKRGLRTLNKKS
ncbi:DNA alkylation repair protein [Methanobrevibacter filiformis]|uniref:DNA alkylation repair enzyme n=1 Tax=Methanobrevibacter filiformis TaxID=55758 RepID=A0A162FA33_9EURY|nr:DNA alkylation repair protein [Methanobrevibacter filiformis]KZX10105.1 DNA alkylation repair enzyme [Methanobrevibacter filiformis]